VGEDPCDLELQESERLYCFASHGKYDTLT